MEKVSVLAVDVKKILQHTENETGDGQNLAEQ
jgi:hypothetical protein